MIGDEPSKTLRPFLRSRSEIIFEFDAGARPPLKEVQDQPLRLGCEITIHPFFEFSIVHVLPSSHTSSPAPVTGLNIFRYVEEGRISASD